MKPVKVFFPTMCSNSSFRSTPLSAKLSKSTKNSRRTSSSCGGRMQWTWEVCWVMWFSLTSVEEAVAIVVFTGGTDEDDGAKVDDNEEPK